MLLLFVLGPLAMGGQGAMSWELVCALSGGCYLAVSLVEGYLASARTGALLAGIAAAWLVAGISVLPVTLPMLVNAALLLTVPTPLHCAVCFDSSTERGLLVVALVVIGVGDAVWAWLVSTLGGCIGGALAPRAMIDGGVDGV